MTAPPKTGRSARGRRTEPRASHERRPVDSPVPSNPPLATGPARGWSESLKRLIIAEAFAPGASVSATARKYNVSSVSLYHWRKRYLLNPVGLIDDSKAREDGSQRAEMRSSASTQRPHGSENVQAQDPDEVSLPIAMSQGAHPDWVTVSRTELARLQTELANSRAHRRFLLGILRTVGEQLRLLADVEDASTIKIVVRDSDLDESSGT
ncbi:MAG: transposase [Alsobacter sp.]